MSRIILADKELEIFGFRVTSELLKSVLRYLVIGFSTFFLDYSLNLILVERVKLGADIQSRLGDYSIEVDAQAALVGIMVTPIVLLFNFSMNRLWSFEDVGSKKGEVKTQAIRYIALVAFNSLVGVLLTYLFYDTWGWSMIATKITITGLVVMWNFPLYRLWVYRK